MTPLPGGRPSKVDTSWIILPGGCLLQGGQPCRLCLPAARPGLPQWPLPPLLLLQSTTQPQLWLSLLAPQFTPRL